MTSIDTNRILVYCQYTAACIGRVVIITLIKAKFNSLASTLIIPQYKLLLDPAHSIIFS